MIQISDRLLFALDGLLFGAAFVIRVGATSPIMWIQNVFAPYAWLQYVLGFLGAFVAAYVWFNRRWKVALILATVFIVFYIILATGFLL